MTYTHYDMKWRRIKTVLQLAKNKTGKLWLFVVVRAWVFSLYLKKKVLFIFYSVTVTLHSDWEKHIHTNSKTRGLLDDEN